MSRRTSQTVVLRRGPAWADGADDCAPEVPAAWEEEREMLLDKLAQQQRVSQAGLVTASLSHDVGNYVQGIMSAAYLGLRSGEPERMAAALEKIESHCAELVDTMRAFLDFVKRRGNAEASTFLASDVIGRTVRLLEPLARSENVALEHACGEDVQVRGEARLVVQALVNLGSNSIRACARLGGTTRIFAAPSTPGWCTLVVSDDGPGIPEEMRGRLFRPFETENADSGGNGLGLFIVRQAVRKLGGSIRVRTSSDGTEIRISLPTC